MHGARQPHASDFHPYDVQNLACLTLDAQCLAISDHIQDKLSCWQVAMNRRSHTDQLACRAPLQFEDVWQLPPGDSMSTLAGPFGQHWKDESTRRGGPSLVGSISQYGDLHALLLYIAFLFCRCVCLLSAGTCSVMQQVAWTLIFHMVSQL